jgi:hypothetical protein
VRDAPHRLRGHYRVGDRIACRIRHPTTHGGTASQTDRHVRFGDGEHLHVLPRRCESWCADPDGPVQRLQTFETELPLRVGLHEASRPDVFAVGEPTEETLVCAARRIRQRNAKQYARIGDGPVEGIDYAADQHAGRRTQHEHEFLVGSLGDERNRGTAEPGCSRRDLVSGARAANRERSIECSHRGGVAVVAATKHRHPDRRPGNRPFVEIEHASPHVDAARKGEGHALRRAGLQIDVCSGSATRHCVRPARSESLEVRHAIAIGARSSQPQFDAERQWPAAHCDIDGRRSVVPQHRDVESSRRRHVRRGRRNANGCASSRSSGGGQGRRRCRCYRRDRRGCVHALGRHLVIAPPGPRAQHCENDHDR